MHLDAQECLVYYTKFTTADADAGVLRAAIRRGGGHPSLLLARLITVPNLPLLMQACYAPLVGVEVVIQDNGAGVLEEELTMLCEEGFRGQACRRYWLFFFWYFPGFFWGGGGTGGGAYDAV